MLWMQQRQETTRIKTTPWPHRQLGAQPAANVMGRWQDDCFLFFWMNLSLSLEGRVVDSVRFRWVLVRSQTREDLEHLGEKAVTHSSSRGPSRCWWLFRCSDYNYASSVNLNSRALISLHAKVWERAGEICESRTVWEFWLSSRTSFDHDLQRFNYIWRLVW